MSDTPENENEFVRPKLYVPKNLGLAISLFLIVWIILGITAFIVSLTCFGKQGSNSDKIIGLLIAALFGPFYWVFYGTNKSYCKMK